ncbi:hypothetical protein EVAR_96137_1 [Eumeta japonica]|uniref:Uncharacterized protein n=1 Tax=Eumeta variegata TaxID=151549 RepID=A0A4C2AAU6_EUMVA|nr:hypothetical protein EVAR_96137_1 [Eumeta japonica]
MPMQDDHTVLCTELSTTPSLTQTKLERFSVILCFNFNRQRNDSAYHKTKEFSSSVSVQRTTRTAGDASLYNHAMAGLRTREARISVDAQI